MSKTKQYVALDVGSRSVRAIWLTMRGAQPTVTRAESFSLPMDAENPLKLIQTWVSSLGLSRQFVATALASGANANFSCGRITHGDPRTPEQMADMDIMQFNEMAGDSMAYAVQGFELAQEPGIRRYLISMAPPNAIRDALHTVNAIGTRPGDLMAAPVALYNAMQFLSQPHEDVHCYIAIGHTTTVVAAGNSQGLMFARNLPVGGKLFTDAIAQTTNLPGVQAEVRKHVDCGLDPDNACAEQLRTAAERWISQLNACLGSYRSLFNDRRLAITRVIITGGGAQLKGFKEYLAARLDLPVITTAALENIPEHYRRHVGTHDLALGLALSSMGAGQAQLSLLPADLRDEVIFRQKKPWWLASAVLLISSMALYAVTGIYQLKRDDAFLTGEREKLNQRQRLDARIQQLRQLQNQVFTNSLPLMTLLKNGPLAREALTLASQCVDPEDWITLFCDEKIYTPKEQEIDAQKPVAGTTGQNPLSLFRTLRPSASAPKTTKEANDRRDLGEALTTRFIIEGYTANPNLKSVGEMITRLKTSPQVVRADLRRDDMVLAPTGIPELEKEQLPDFKRFVIELELKRP